MRVAVRPCQLHRRSHEFWCRHAASRFVTVQRGFGRGVGCQSGTVQPHPSSLSASSCIMGMFGITGASRHPCDVPDHRFIVEFVVKGIMPCQEDQPSSAIHFRSVQSLCLVSALSDCATVCSLQNLFHGLPSLSVESATHMPSCIF